MDSGARPRAFFFVPIFFFALARQSGAAAAHAPPLTFFSTPPHTVSAGRRLPRVGTSCTLADGSSKDEAGYKSVRREREKAGGMCRLRQAASPFFFNLPPLTPASFPFPSSLPLHQVQRRLIAGLVIAAAFMLVEAVGGFWAHSIAIWTDAAHLLSDVSGFAVALVASRVAARAAAGDHTFGYHRVEVLGALASVAMTWFVTGVLVIEAAGRIAKPKPVDGRLMFILAAVGVGVNLLLMAVLGGHHHHGPGGHDHGCHAHGGDDQAGDEAALDRMKGEG